MDRRKSIKALFIGTVASSVLIDACKTEDKKVDAANNKDASFNNDERQPEEQERLKKEMAETC